jgi:hypothetical protein
VPDWDNTESRERDEDAAWRDLIARFAAPAADGPVPWPERENMPAPPGTKEAGDGDGPGEPDGAVSGAARQAQAGPGDDPVAAKPEQEPEGTGTLGAQGAGGIPKARGDGETADADRIWRALEAEGLLGQTEPDVIQATRRLSLPPAEWIPVPAAAAEEEDEDEDEGHFVPPEPPPLPKLDPVTKGAWAALFGGPGYLMVATALHWSVPGYAAFCAVAAFVTGFALLVLRMNDPGPGGRGDGDDGAVV